MGDLLYVAGIFVVLLGLSIAASWAGFALWNRLRGPVELEEGALLRLRAEGAVYRSRVLHAAKDGIVIAAPMQRDAHIPLREGSRLLVETPTPRGLLIFRSSIVSRNRRDHSITLCTPSSAFLANRRTCRRICPRDPVAVLIEDQPSRLIDVSEEGARLRYRDRVSRGERLRIAMPGLSDQIYGWVLEASPEPYQGGTDVRVRFEDRIDLPQALKDGTLA
jgi:hypothetical protein